MPDEISQQTVLRVADLPQNRATPFLVKPHKGDLAAIASELGILGIRKLVFRGTVRGEGKSDWQLNAQLGATVEQSCVVTLDPVTTRIDESVSRKFVAGLSNDLTEEVEMPEDDSQEALGANIDLMRVLTEALALSLPDYPRGTDATLEQNAFAAPDVTPMTDADAKPFAGLSQLKKKLEKGD